MTRDRIETYYQSYLDTLAPGHPHRGLPTPEAWGFGDTPEMADELGGLVLRGVKTATASLLWEYELEREAVPRPGGLSIVLDGKNEPLCIIEVVEVKVQPFNRVDAQFAYDEGEGERTLEFWRAAHWRFFSRACIALGRAAAEDMPVVCERFKVAFGG